ncbi:hypothetical protein FH972_025415 [Carpinus fangiana]|uniref:Uncharacterized protein n=1 Tax=Carpinus fangiana TaxID=176857 RepID=A0A5N6L1C6_9ROSI|nr:hypothetical protein FH972_025415 [Carpinus fangiana]
MWKYGNRLKAWNGPQKCRVSILITSLILILVVLISIYGDNGQNTRLSSGLLKQKWNSLESLVQFHPTTEVQNGAELIWQIPDTPKAVIFLAHGCNGRAVNFWDRSSTCPNCIGLPEERLLTLHALARKFAVLTISSAGRCWTLGKERFIVKDIMKGWVERNKLQQLPIVALGASSGGHFVSVLATELKFSSITLMIAEGVFDKIDISEDYPPTLFVHMPKDVSRQQKIDENLELLRNKGVDVAEIECMEFPLSPHLLSDRIPGIEQTFSIKLFELFRDKGFIDENGYMKNDGRATRWKAALRESKSYIPDQHLAQHIQEELNLAFAFHEMTSLHSEQIFKWFESHMS